MRWLHRVNGPHFRQAKREPRRRRVKGKRGRGTAASDKPPILGMIQRGGWC